MLQAVFVFGEGAAHIVPGTKLQSVIFARLRTAFRAGPFAPKELSRKKLQKSLQCPIQGAIMNESNR